MKATLNFINSYFWKSIYAPFFSFVFPSVLLLILGNIFRLEYTFTGIISFSIMLISIFLIPLTLSDVRASTFKFIGSSPIGKGKFMIFAFAYFTLIIIMGIIVQFIFLIIMFHSKVWPSVSSSKFYWEVAPDHDPSNALGMTSRIVSADTSVLSWMNDPKIVMQFMFSIALHILLCFSISLGLLAITKTTQQILVLAFTIILPSMFLSGMIISIDIIAESDVLRWISRFIPFTYTTGNIIESSTPIFNTKLIVSGHMVNGVEAKGAITTLKSNDQLKDLILGREYSILHNSNGNIFDFNSSFAVRRVPKIDRITWFVKSFLAGGDPHNPNTDPIRFSDIWNNNIKKSDYGFLELFFNQNNVLYENYDKILNIFVPITLTTTLFIVSAKNLRWTIE